MVWLDRGGVAVMAILLATWLFISGYTPAALILGAIGLGTLVFAFRALIDWYCIS